MADGLYYVGPATSAEEALSRLRSYPGFIACDTETVNTRDRSMLGIGFAWGANEAIFFTGYENWDSPYMESPYLPLAVEVLKDSRPKWFWNVVFDLEVIDYRFGFEVENYQDLSICARVQALPGSLEDNCGWIFNEVHQVIRDILPERGTMLDVPVEKTAWKCINDCLATWRIADKLRVNDWFDLTSPGFIWKDRMGKSWDVTVAMKKAYDLDRKMLPILRRMGKKGVKLNKDALLRHYERLAEEKFRYQGICEQMYGFNPGSNQQVAYILAKRGNWLPFTKGSREPGKKKQLSVDEDTLLSLSDPLARVVLEYRKRADKLSDIIEPYLGKPKGEKGKKIPFREWQFPNRVGTHWKLDLATSRLSSYGVVNAPGIVEDNLQNVTPELRDVYEPDDKVWTWWDLSQIEMRLFTYFSKDPKLEAAYRDNQSIHLLTMKALFPGQWKFPCCKADKCSCGLNDENPVYTDSKTFNFAMIYFAEALALARQTKRPLGVVEDLRWKWFQQYSTGYAWMKRQAEEAMGRGYAETLEGRRCRIPDPLERGEGLGGEHHAMVCGVNYLVQGSAAWPVKLAFIDMDKWGWDFRLQVHDEAVIDGDVKDLVVGEHKKGVFSEYLPGLDTPFEVKKGPIWR